MRYRYYYESLRRDLTNLSFLRHRKFSGYLVSMHQSGTHWLKHILASAIAAEYSLPKPRYSHANEIIGGPKDPIIYPAAPHLASSHTIPSPLLRSKLFRYYFHPPRYVVLVRDMRDTLVSNYMKWKDLYECGFSEYLHDFSGKKFHNQIWWCIRFLNAWGDLIQKYPDQNCAIRYEDMCGNTYSQICRINDFLGLHLSRESIMFGISESSKEKMKKKTESGRPEGAGIVSSHKMKPGDLFSPEDEKFLNIMCTLLLRHRFNYDYY